MNLLSITAWVNGTTIAANIATCLGVIGIAITVLLLIKNKVSKNTVQIKVTALNSFIFSEDHKRIYFNIDFYNFTDKQFFIITIEFVIENTHYIFSELYKPDYHSLSWRKREIKNIGVLQHEAMTIEGFIELERKKILPGKLKVLIGTTEKNLSFCTTVYKTENFYE